jgi:hypothetical protein
MVSGLSRRRSSEAPFSACYRRGYSARPRLPEHPGARCIRPLEAGAAVLVHRGFVRIAPAEQAPFVDWVERVDKHVGATQRNPGRDATIAEPSDNVSFGSASKAGFGQPSWQFAEEPFIHGVTIQKSVPRPRQS